MIGAHVRYRPGSLAKAVFKAGLDFPGIGAFMVQGAISA